MGDLERTVRIIFQGDDKATRTMKNLAGGLDDLQSSADSLTGPLADLADNLLLVEGAMAAVALAGKVAQAQPVKAQQRRFRSRKKGGEDYKSKEHNSQYVDV